MADEEKQDQTTEEDQIDLDEKEFSDAFDEEVSGSGDTDPAPDESDTDEHTPDESAGDTTGDELQAPDEEPDDLPEEDKQRAKSWEGRLKAEEQRIKEMREELERQQDELKISSQKRDTEKDEGPDDDLKDIVSDLKEKYDLDDDFYDALDLMTDRKAKEIASKLRDELSQEQKVAEETRARKQAYEAHVSAIEKMHPDREEVVTSQRFQSWMGTHQNSADWKLFYQYGNADQVNRMLTQYKKESGLVKKETKPENPRMTDKAKKLEPVNTTVGFEPKGKPDPDDYEGAWEEEARKRQAARK